MCLVLCCKLTGSNKDLMRNAQVDFKSQCRVLIHSSVRPDRVWNKS